MKLLRVLVIFYLTICLSSNLKAISEESFKKFNNEECIDKLKILLEQFVSYTKDHYNCILYHRDKIEKSNYEAIDKLKLCINIPLNLCPSDKIEDIYFDVQYCYIQVRDLHEESNMNEKEEINNIFLKACKPYIDKFNEVALPLEK